MQSLAIGGAIASLSPGETQLASQIVATTTGLTRSWEYWSMRVAKAGGAAAKPANKPAKPARAASKPKRAAKARRR